MSVNIEVKSSLLFDTNSHEFRDIIQYLSDLTNLDLSDIEYSGDPFKNVDYVYVVCNYTTTKQQEKEELKDMVCSIRCGEHGLVRCYAELAMIMHILRVVNEQKRNKKKTNDKLFKRAMMVYKEFFPRKANSIIAYNNLYYSRNTYRTGFCIVAIAIMLALLLIILVAIFAQ